MHRGTLSIRGEKAVIGNKRLFLFVGARRCAMMKLVRIDLFFYLPVDIMALR